MASREVVPKSITLRCLGMLATIEFKGVPLHVRYEDTDGRGTTGKHDGCRFRTMSNIYTAGAPAKERDRVARSIANQLCGGNPLPEQVSAVLAALNYLSPMGESAPDL